MDALTAPRLRVVLLLLAVTGLVVPWWFNLDYFAAGGGIAPAVFFGTAFANPLTTAITLDVYIAALAFSVAVAADRGGGRTRWWAIAGTFAVGLSAALPAYLWWRGRAADVAAHAPNSQNGRAK